MAERDLAERLHAEGLRASGWANAPGDRYAEHRHEYDKVIVVERGSIVFGLADGVSLSLEAGDRLELPAWTAHDAVVGLAGVACLEAHLPIGSLGAAPRRIPAGSW